MRAGIVERMCRLRVRVSKAGSRTRRARARRPSDLWVTSRRLGRGLPNTGTPWREPILPIPAPFGSSEAVDGIACSLRSQETLPSGRSARTTQAGRGRVTALLGSRRQPSTPSSPANSALRAQGLQLDGAHRGPRPRASLGDSSPRWPPASSGSCCCAVVRAAPVRLRRGREVHRAVPATTKLCAREPGWTTVSPS